MTLPATHPKPSRGRSRIAAYRLAAAADAPAPAGSVLSPPIVGERLMRVREVLAVVGAARPTLYQWMQRGTFPRPLKLSGQMVAWREAEIRAWLASRSRALGGDPPAAGSGR